FSPAAGLMGAGVMAVSPFAVYLSQEARHYTLPMVLIVLALLGLIQIQQHLCKARFPPAAVWLGWVIVNSIGFYVHYFFILAFIAQVMTLIERFYRCTLPRRYWGGVALAVTSVGLSYLLWVPTLLGHLSRPETDWLKLSPHGWVSQIAPIYQMLAGWLIMVIALPIENQPFWSAVPAALLMVLFGGWLGLQSIRGMRQLWQTPQTYPATQTLASFTLWVLLEFFVIVYLLGKDITVAPRYNFTYYPSICALLGASLVNLPSPSQPRVPAQPNPLDAFCKAFGFGKSRRSKAFQIQATVLLVGVLSCFCVVYDLAFQKPFYPQRVAKHLSQEPAASLAVVVRYDTFQDVALGMSYALQVDKLYPHRNQGAPNAYWAFFQQSPADVAKLAPGQESAWQNFPKVVYPLNLWLISPRHPQQSYPLSLTISQTGKQLQATCTLDPNQSSEVSGISSQYYRCHPDLPPKE
ncbi:MAG TPA: hypothetical protein V6D03_00940, partial [Candidatus Caenarcaniphilales bacterium]